MKACRSCGSSGPFYAAKTCKDGLTARCAACIKARVLARQKTHPEAHRAARKRWQKRHSAQQIALTRRWRAAHRETDRAARRLWLKENIEKNRAKVRRYKVRKLGAVSALTETEWLAILEYFDYRCAYCLRNDRPLEQDHVIALARGGDHTADNVVPACKADNCRKKDRPVFLMASTRHLAA